MASPKWKHANGWEDEYRDKDGEDSSEEGEPLFTKQPFYNLKLDRLQTSSSNLPYKIALATCSIIILILVYVVANPGPKQMMEAVTYKPLDYSAGPSPGELPPAPRQALVLASYKSQNIQWMKDIDQEQWTVYRYILDDDDPFSSLSVPRNKGREGMAYLTYIIDHYYNLPDYIVFIHGHNRAWHQLAPTPWKIAALNLTALDEAQYINLRCGNDPGCTPETLNGANFPTPADTPIDGEIMPLFWKLVFPQGTSWGDEVGTFPEAVGQPCCAQFAVTKAAIRRRPIEFWKGFRNPMTRDINENRKALGDPWLTSHRMGTYYEKVWHVAFGMPAMNCPHKDYCQKVYFSDAIQCERDTGRFKVSHDWKKIKCNTTLPQFAGPIRQKNMMDLP